MLFNNFISQKGKTVDKLYYVCRNVAQTVMCWTQGIEVMLLPILYLKRESER